MVYRLSIVTGSFIFCLGLVLEVAHFWERPEIHGALLVFWETMDIYIYIDTLIDYMNYDYINLRSSSQSVPISGHGPRFTWDIGEKIMVCWTSGPKGVMFQEPWGYSSDPDVSALESDVMMQTDSTVERLGKTRCWKHWGNLGKWKLKWTYIDVQNLVHWDVGGIFFSTFFQQIHEFVTWIWDILGQTTDQLDLFSNWGLVSRSASWLFLGGGHLATPFFHPKLKMVNFFRCRFILRVADGLTPKITDGFLGGYWDRLKTVSQGFPSLENQQKYLASIGTCMIRNSQIY